ncbi:50S ribosomal protein L4 [Candidatus Rariloculus sp.]|uniref:50S ribosomal protein L4 n=1 Tax=Candidatus Rariloculus sp. TaxID=3101265 RepID=UPI003D14CB2C
MKVKLHDNTGMLEIADSLFAAKFNEPLIHQVVTAYLSGQRAGTKAQKNRSDARGGGAKPWRQKGTGRARAGTIRSPIWVGGGRTFAARPRDHSQKVNRKMYRGALRSLLSELLRQERLLITNELTLEAPKTKALKARLDEFGIDRGLLVVEAFDRNLWLAARNLPHVFVAAVAAIDPVSLVAADRVVMTAAAAKILEERLG